MDIQTKDGILLRGIPDGTPEAEIKARINKIRAESGMKDYKAMSAPAPVDPTDDMSTLDRFLAGAGKSFVDGGRGLRQIFANDREKTQKDIDEAAALDKPLMNTGAGIVGNVLGNAALFAPTAFIPGANTYRGAALVGAAANALGPVATGQDRGTNAAMGAIAGPVGLAAGRGIGRAISPVASKLNPQEELLAAAARREGIPLTVGQTTGSRPVQIAESVMENLPLTSTKQLAGREAQQRAFTAAALKKAGISADEATSGVLTNQRNMLGNQLNKIASGNTLDFYRPSQTTQAPLISELDRILVEAEKRGKTASEPVREIVMNIVNEINQAGSMAGKNYQAWRQTLNPLAKGGGADAHYYGQIRKALDSAFNEQIATTGGAQAWKDTNRQYANLKTIMQAAGGPGTPAATGQLSPSQLSAALRQSMGKEGVALGRGDLNELSRVGQQFVKDQVPNSGTAQRQFIQSLLTGQAAGIIPGAGLGYALDGQEGAVKGAALGAGLMLGGPKAAQSVLQSPMGRRYIERGIVPVSEAQRAALAQALRAISTASVPAVVNQ